MPIVFIANGIFLISLLFDLIKLKSEFQKIYLIVFSIMYSMSFFSEYVLISDIYVNLFQIASIMILLIFIIRKSNFDLFNFVYVIIASIIYYSLVNVSSNYMVSSNSIFVVVLALIPAMFSKNSFNSLSVIIFSSIIMILISVKFEIIEFTFTLLNLNIIFETIFVYFLLKIIIFGIKNLKRGVFYETNSYIIDDFNTSISSLIFK